VPSAPDDPTRRDHEGDPLGPRLVAFWEGGTRSCALPAEGSIVIGRSLECGLVIDHPSVSRRHAILHVESGGSCRLEDLGASNGTSVGGAPVPTRSSVRLGPGHTIGIGRAVVVIEAGVTRDVPAHAEGAMQRLHQLATTIAASHLSVLISGETGVGKEVLAEYIHRASPRAAGPFVRLNCAALPENLLESELFGFERGAFTGASAAKPGLLEAAHRGTAFLDEIGEMAPAIQAKLLRAVESREVMRLGSTSSRTIDVRFVCATHRDLKELVKSGRFRQDLYFRVNGAGLAIPPLRERRAELLTLAQTFAAETARRMAISVPPLTQAVLSAFEAYAWPGNIRELKNVVERAVVLSGGRSIGLEHLPGELIEPSSTMSPSSPPSSKIDVLKEELSALERERIERALADACGNQTRAAKILGISRRTLLKRLDAYAFPRPRK
jgi:two-component system, NtrC family, response regulator AtoC